MWQYAIDDGPVIVEDSLSDELFKYLHDDRIEIVIHNSHFDRTLIRHCAGVTLDTARIFDTMVCALAHSLPGSLEQLGQIFGLSSDKAKDKEGKKLINLFCKPQKAKDQKLFRADKATHPVEWEKFRQYGKQDIIAMREIYKLLPRWNFKAVERKVWELDQKINDRGICIDLELCEAALKATTRAKKEYDDETFIRTKGRLNTTARRDRLLEYLDTAHGVKIDGLTAAAVRKLLETELPEDALALLEIRLQANKNSSAKYRTVINAINKDQRLRGLLQFCGASRTGRWSGRLFQPQNLPRPTLTNAEVERAICELKNNAHGLI